MGIMFLNRKTMEFKNQNRRRNGRVADYENLLRQLGDAGHGVQGFDKSQFKGENQKKKTPLQLQQELVAVITEIVAVR